MCVYRYIYIYKITTITESLNYFNTAKKSFKILGNADDTKLTEKARHKI
jgi:hypothetical protein